MHRSLITTFTIIALFTMTTWASHTAIGQAILPKAYLPIVQSSNVLPAATQTATAPPPTATQTATAPPTATQTATVPPTATQRATATSTSSPTATNTPTQQPTGSVDIRKTSAFVPYEGSDSLYIVGEVVNNTTGDIESVQINAVLRDIGGSIIGGGNGYSLMQTLSPGMAGPFRVSLSNVPDGWQSYELTVNHTSGTRGPIGLELSSLENYFDGSDAFHIRGTVRNQTGENREFVKVVVTLYDSADVVIGVGDQYTNPYDLTPGQQVLFDIELYFWSGKPDRNRIASYSVLAYDD